MVAPVLEIHVVWHPDDAHGAIVHEELLGHFRGTTYSGLIGGAVEVYGRSSGWLIDRGAPRRILLPGERPTRGVLPGDHVIVVPVLSDEMRLAFLENQGGWRDYLRQLMDAQHGDPDHVRVLHLVSEPGLEESGLLALFDRTVRLGHNQGRSGRETVEARRSRELVAEAARWIEGRVDPVEVFLSHTKRAGTEGDSSLRALISMVRSVLAETRLGSFFDAQDLQPGEHLAAVLEEHASRAAMLVLRTDEYSSRPWCLREVLVAKGNGMPVVSLEALSSADQRGSFLLDHVPRVPVVSTGPEGEAAVRRAVDLLVDEWFKRVLWLRQEQLARDVLPGRPVWWSAQAPEPVTLVQRLAEFPPQPGSGPIIVVHPDPPLTSPEFDLLRQFVVDVVGHTDGFRIVTPAALRVAGETVTLPEDDHRTTLVDALLAISLSPSPDLARLGLTEHHVGQALAEVARAVLIAGGRLAYGGHLGEDGYTAFLAQELLRYGASEDSLRVYLAWSQHRRDGDSAVRAGAGRLGSLARVIRLDPAGTPYPGPDRGAQPDGAIVEPGLDASSLTTMRERVTADSRARVLLGGKREGYRGRMPGVVEEALISLRAGQPLFLAGGFGGATLDVIREITPDDASWFVGAPAAGANDAGLREGLAALREVRRSDAWKGLQNGLTDDQNRLLATTHRPGEIAGLVDLGLRRIAVEGAGGA